MKPKSADNPTYDSPIPSSSSLPIKEEEDIEFSIPGEFYDSQPDISTEEPFDLSEEDEVLSSLQPTEENLNSDTFPTAYNTAGNITPALGDAYSFRPDEALDFTEFGRRLSLATQSTDTSELLNSLEQTPAQVTTLVKEEEIQPYHIPDLAPPTVPLQPPIQTKPTVVLPNPMSNPGQAGGAQPVAAAAMSMRMPFRRERSAPTIFDEANPGRELSRYLQDLEALFTRYSITDNAEKKKWLTHYPGVAVADFWESLAEFADANSTYEQLKTTIIKQYPDADANRKYEHMDIERVVGKYAREISSLAELGTYYREFYPKAQFLESKKRLSGSEISNLFSKGFPDNVWEGIMRRLQIKLPDHFPSDPYALSEIYEAAQFVLQGTSRGESLYASAPQPYQAGAGYVTYNPPVVSSIPQAYTSRMPDPVVVKPEPSEISLHLQAIEEKIAQLVQMQIQDKQDRQQRRNNYGTGPQLLYASSPSTRDGNCGFCGKQGHYINACEDIDVKVREGKCRRNTKNHIVLPMGAYLPKGLLGNCLADKIEEWHQQNPGQLGAVTTMMQFVREPLTFVKNAEQYAQLVDKRSLPANMTITQRVEALIAKTGSIEKELQSLQQCADASEDETLKTWFKQVEVRVPRLARQNPVRNTEKSSEKKSAPETSKEVSVPIEPTKTTGRLTRNSQKAAGEPEKQKSVKKAQPKGDEYDRELTPDFDDMPSLVDVSDSDDSDTEIRSPQTEENDVKEAEAIKAITPTVKQDKRSKKTERELTSVPNSTRQSGKESSLDQMEEVIPENIHPFASARPANYAPPVDRNIGAKPDYRKKVRDHELAYRTKAPIEDALVARNVYERTMDAPVTLSQRELFSLSPEIRDMTKDDITKRKVPPTVEHFKNDVSYTGPGTVEIKVPSGDPEVKTMLLYGPPNPVVQTFEQVKVEKVRKDPPEGSFVVQDPYEARIKKGEKIGPLKCAAESIALRSILPIVDHQLKVECIIDPGSQVISMSETVCHRLGLTYDPTVIIDMQSANGTLNSSLGLARNVAFLFGDITLYLQVHVIRQSVYDILLGRPFDTLTQSIVRNYENQDQTITIHDPNTGKTATIPTRPRGRIRLITNDPYEEEDDP